MKTMWNKIKGHAIWSKVVATLIAAGILTGMGYLFSALSGHSIIPLIFNLLVLEYTLPVWELILISMIPLTAVVAITAVIRRKRKQKENAWESYTEDDFLRILWNWEYLYGSQVNYDSLVARCPKCKRKLITKASSDFLGSNFYLICFNCDYKTDTFDGKRRMLDELVVQMIDGRIHSGEYKNRLKRRT